MLHHMWQELCAMQHKNALFCKVGYASQIVIRPVHNNTTLRSLAVPMAFCAIQKAALLTAILKWLCCSTVITCLPMRVEPLIV